VVPAGAELWLGEALLPDLAVLEALVAAGAEPSRLVHYAVAAGDDQAVAR
jgi:hypothetical protein